MKAGDLFSALTPAIMIAFALTASHYRANAIEYKEQRDTAITQRNDAKATIADMQARQRVVVDIDAKYTRELTDAKATIDQLERNVIAGNQRLRVNASCKPMSSTATSSGLDDATRAGLSDTAQRDYFTLRKRIETARSQIAGLQDYIRNVCLK